MVGMAIWFFFMGKYTDTAGVLRTWVPFLILALIIGMSLGYGG
jgi:hypothetical protein